MTTARDKTPAPPRRLTLPGIARMARDGRPFACITCYDATTARWLQRAGVHILLVGDTAAEVILGHTRTIDIDLSVLLALTAGVKRGAPETLVMGDMPFMSYQASPDDAMRNAGRFISEGLADIIKLEADATLAGLIERMVRTGIPVCGHVGSKPQRIAITGGYASAGRTRDSADTIVADAVALEQAGCQMLLVEAVPDEVTVRILEATRVPLIGIGAGPACHGQVVVLQDLLGMSDRVPPFVKPLARLGSTIEDAGRAWVDLVSRRAAGPSPYSMKPDAPATEKPSVGIAPSDDRSASPKARLVSRLRKNPASPRRPRGRP